MHFLIVIFNIALLVAVTVILSIGLYYYYILYRTRKYLYKWPTLPQIPILGSALVCRSSCDIYENLFKYAKMYGRNVWLMLGPQPILITCDAKLMDVILSSPKHINKQRIYKILDKIIGDGLITSNGDNWRLQRKILTPTFHSKILEDFMPIFNKHATKMIQTLESETKKDSTDIKEVTEKCSIEQVTETVMGLKADGTSNDATLYMHSAKECIKIAIERLIRLQEFIDFTYFFTSNYWRELKYLRLCNDHINSVIREKKTELAKKIQSKSSPNNDAKRKRTASLEMLIEYQMKGGQITESHLNCQVQTLLLAGYDTTATTVAFAVYNLARNPEIQAKLYEEAYSILGNDINQEITTSHLQDMKYLDMVLNESMRITSSVPVMGRELSEDIEYDGMTLPKGLMVSFALCVLHNDPEYFPEPEKFIPERFTPKNCKTRPKYAYIPFSAGPRNCIGKKYAILAVKVGLLKLLLNYEFHDVNHKLCLGADIVAMPTTGVKVGIKKREHTKPKM